MNAEELRSLQAPVKERYRQQPGTALITLRAEGRLGEGVVCKIETGKSLVEAGLHPATGGDGLSACSGDMLLEALVGCAGVTLNAVATALGIRLRDATVRAEGDLDFRGTLAVSKEAPVGFRAIRLGFVAASLVLFGSACSGNHISAAGSGRSDGALSSCRVALECRVHGNALSKLA